MARVGAQTIQGEIRKVAFADDQSARLPETGDERGVALGHEIDAVERASDRIDDAVVRREARVSRRCANAGHVHVVLEDDRDSVQRPAFAASRERRVEAFSVLPHSLVDPDEGVEEGFEGGNPRKDRCGHVLHGERAALIAGAHVVDREFGDGRRRSAIRGGGRLRQAQVAHLGSFGVKSL